MCPKGKESSEKLSIIEANSKKIPSSQKIFSLKDCFDEITTPPGESRSRNERGDCRFGESSSMRAPIHFPIKRRGSHDDVAALSTSVCVNQSKTKKSLQEILNNVEYCCGEAGIGAPY
jgi:hypothetical protein